MKVEDDDNLSKGFSDLSSDRQNEVLQTAKTLLKVQRVSNVLIANTEYLTAFSNEKTKAD
jgi:hypothetical protein